MAPETAVAFVIREKFAWSLASLERLYALAGAPFTLYIVDGVYPPAIRAGLENFLADKPNVVWIDADRYLYSSEALNLVVERMTEQQVFLLQTDVLIGRDALKFALETMRELQCDAVAPLILDTDAGAPAVHRESNLPVAYTEEGGKLYIHREAAPESLKGRRRVHYFEMHCLLMTAAAARAVCPLPPLSIHEHIDMGIAMWRAGMTTYLDERARVLFMDSPPLPLRDFEVPFYRFRWDPVRARQSDGYVRDKWHPADLFDGMHFIAHQHAALRPEAILRSYDRALEADPWPAELPGL
jgi:GT2 family glycosyltransferase